VDNPFANHCNSRITFSWASLVLHL